MVLLLLKRFLLVVFIFSSLHSFAGIKNRALREMPAHVYFLSVSNEHDSSVNIPKSSIKICSCQVLDLQSTNHRHRNIALFAEKTNGRSLSFDMGRINKIMEKEKKHMQSFFYDKLTVVNVFTESTDCRSLFSKLKTKNKSLVLYDILNADTRR
jgi:hypothetical protein